MHSPSDRNAGVPGIGSLRVLLLEDNPDDVELCKHLLKKAHPGARCDVVLSRDDFTKHLKTDSYDVILADYALGNWTGLEAFRLMQDVGRTIPFILLTGVLGDEKAIECIKSGIADYILKDRPERLALAISHALEDHHRAEEHRQAVCALAASEARLRILTESIAAATFVEQGGRCCYANRAAECITGYDREELSKTTFWDLLLPSSRQALTRLTDIEARNSFQSGRRYEVQILTKQGEMRCLDITAGVFENEGQTAALITAFDISERNQREVAERRHLEDQSRQSQKMEALGQLSGGVAHDFNNLLSVIIGYAERIQGKLDQTDPLHVGIDRILTAADRAASLTRQLLAFSRQQVLDFKALDLNAVVCEMKDMLGRLIGEDIELTTILGSGPMTVRADEGQLQQIILNLAVNARDAMPEGGKLVIETSVVIEKGFPFQVGPYVCLSVTDTGIGMDAEIKSRVYEPFFTTKEKGKGTGLGLSTVYGVVKQSGGHIDLLSSRGEGTVFKIYLPQINEAVETKKAAHEAETSPVSTGNETVLVVEDEASLRTLIGDTLRLYGYAVLEAKNGIDALIVARTHRGGINLLLTDVVMPAMNGRMLAQELSRQRPGIGVVYMSGYIGQEADTRASIEQGSFFLAKPFTWDRLIRKIREALDEAHAATIGAKSRLNQGGTELAPGLHYGSQNSISKRFSPRETNPMRGIV